MPLVVRHVAGRVADAQLHWYGRQTDKLVDDRIKTLSEELCRAGWQKLHIEKLVGDRRPEATQAKRRQDLATCITSWPRAAKRWAANFEWDALLAVAPTDLQPRIRAGGLSAAGRRGASS